MAARKTCDLGSGGPARDRTEPRLTAAPAPPATCELTQPVSGRGGDDHSDGHPYVRLGCLFHRGIGGAVRSVLVFVFVPDYQLLVGRAHSRRGFGLAGFQAEPAADAAGEFDDAVRLAQGEGIPGGRERCIGLRDRNVGLC